MNATRALHDTPKRTGTWLNPPHLNGAPASTVPAVLSPTAAAGPVDGRAPTAPEAHPARNVAA